MEHKPEHIERVRANSFSASRLLRNEVRRTLDHFVGSRTNDEEKREILDTAEKLDIESFVKTYEAENREDSGLELIDRENTIKDALKIELVMALKKRYAEDSLPDGIQNFISTFIGGPYPRS